MYMYYKYCILLLLRNIILDSLVVCFHTNGLTSSKVSIPSSGGDRHSLHIVLNVSNPECHTKWE